MAVFLSSIFTARKSRNGKEVDVRRGFVCSTRSNNCVAEIDFGQKDYEKAKEIVRDILMIIERRYFPDGPKQKARCVDCMCRNI
jgi:CRISPR-associated exonuclease Cas4